MCIKNKCFIIFRGYVKECNCMLTAGCTESTPGFPQQYRLPRCWTLLPACHT